MIIPCLDNLSLGLSRSLVTLDDLLRSELVWFVFLFVRFGLFFKWHVLIIALQKLPIDSGFRITTLVFFTPEEKIMKVAEAQRSGYGVANTATRLLLRSPKTSPETYTQNVSRLQFTALQTGMV